MSDLSTEEILDERNKVHGDYSVDARMAQQIKALLRTGLNWNDLSPIQRESIEMISTKLARIMSGDPHHKDHWDDIAGYAKLVAQRL